MPKQLKSLLVLACFLGLMTHAYSQPQTIFKLDKNNQNKTFEATITIKNPSDQTIEHWQLGLTFIRPIIETSNAVITSQVGGFYVLSPDPQIATIPAHSAALIHLLGKHAIHHESDAPSGYFLILTNPKTQQQNLVATTATTQLPSWKPDREEDEYHRTIQQNNTSIEGNPIQPTITLNESLIVPLPAELKRNQGIFTLKPDTRIIIDDSHDTKDNAEFFAAAINPATGYHLNIQTQQNNSNLKNVIVFTHQDADTSLKPEGYQLDITSEKITIRANDSAGFFYAAESLRQLLPPEIFAKNKVKNTAWTMPALTIRDYPRFTYRGMHLDVARHFIPANDIKRFLDLMALHKLNRFQWHLSDDEGWRIEIKKYPTLTSIGSHRGFNQPIPPALGSGFQTYGGFYTQNEIRDIIAYATARHITIIPEIDMPGHARALLMSLPETLADPNENKTYDSVQQFHDNVLSPCLENTYTVIDNILTEVAALFPSETIHVGSDEIPKGVWATSPRCIALMASLNLKNSDELQHYFFTRIQHILQTKNKKMAGWGEIVQHGELDPSTTVYSWFNEKAGLNAAERGYPVIMSPAKYVYFDLAYNADPKEPGFVWAGFVDTFQVYSYQPIQTSWPESITHHIQGIQGALWSENINSRQRLDYLAFPKMLALAEVAWTPKERRNWVNFSERLGKLHLQRLDNYGVNYRISLPGINSEKLSEGILEANNEFPGLALRYTLNGTSPSIKSPVYRGPIPIKNTTITMRTFSKLNRGSRIAKS